MDKDKIIAVIKEKVKLPDGVAEKAAGLLDGKNLASGGGADKNSIVKMLVSKLKISEDIANKIYDAVAGALASGAVNGVIDKVKGIFNKK